MTTGFAGDGAAGMAAVVAAAFVSTAVLTRFAIPFFKKLNAGQSIRAEGPESHLSKSGTPTMGGIAIVAGTAFAMFFISPIWSTDTLVILAIFAAYAALGFFDDYVKVRMKRNLGLTALQKILLQAAIAVAATLYQISISGNNTALYVPFFDKTVDFGILYVPFVVFVIVAMVNSVNLTDGLDGLASGVTAIVALYFALAGGASPEASAFCAALTGGCLGFLLYNRYPARIFMGDTGSLALGGGLAVSAILLHQELILPVVGFVYVAEALSVIIQVASYKTRKKRVFKMAPLHHHFELCGWSERNVVRSFWGASLLLALAAFMLLP
ncbi:MAG: phospho-N-acetylmuramoyl-pentapeptide-transferase [Clostridiales Family XIII bacterium]|jgi:phospho-N-acetylmuramoyl-pentapeptide-transferase|nr:phospho-N-acetylmuramoyl-pentapeptide-transferase [Clostridiales Family XIII bacterium]